MALILAFLKRVHVPVEGCWEYTGTKNTAGYGAVSAASKKTVLAHRLSYEIFKGDIPIGLMIRHTCDRPSCVNPEHLIAGTHAENMQDRSDRQRQHYTGGKRKLTEAIVLDLRQRFVSEGFVMAHEAKKLGVGAHALYDVLRGAKWKPRRADGKIIRSGAAYKAMVACAKAQAERAAQMSTKMTAEKAREMRSDRMNGWSYPRLLKKYGVGFTMVKRILANTAWIDESAKPICWSLIKLKSAASIRDSRTWEP